MPDYKELLHNTQLWAREVGLMQLSKSKQSIHFHCKTTDIDMVTEVDILSEKMLIDHIQATYPDHSILSEEKGFIQGRAPMTWVIDPLDGTTNYLHKYPVYSVSIGIKEGDETVIGVVYLSATDEMFYAVKGQGAFLNGEPIRVSETEKLQAALVATGFPYDKATSDLNNLDIFNGLIKEIAGIRRSGSASYDLCCVACGRLDGYWELKLRPWDMEAGGLILREAGGQISEKRNGTYVNIISGNPAIYKALSEKIKEINSSFE